MLVSGPFFLEVGSVVVKEEQRHAGGFEGGPIAADDSVMSDNRLENAAVIVGTVTMFGREDDVAALVGDKVFIVWRNE